MAELDASPKVGPIDGISAVWSLTQEDTAGQPPATSPQLQGKAGALGSERHRFETWLCPFHQINLGVLFNLGASVSSSAKWVKSQRGFSELLNEMIYNKRPAHCLAHIGASYEGSPLTTNPHSFGKVT